MVVGVGDPNPLVASQGLATLRQAGIEVSVLRWGSGYAAAVACGFTSQSGWRAAAQVVMMDGPERQAAYDLNAEFMTRMEQEALARAAAAAAQGAGQR